MKVIGRNGVASAMVSIPITGTAAQRVRAFVSTGVDVGPTPVVKPENRVVGKMTFKDANGEVLGSFDLFPENSSGVWLIAQFGGYFDRATTLEVSFATNSPTGSGRTVLYLDDIDVAPL